MPKFFVFSSIALIALLFTNPGVFAKTAGDQFAILECIQKNLSAAEDEDIDAYWETCKPESEQAKAQTSADLKTAFEIFDLSYTIESYKLLKLEGDQADVEIVMVTKKVRGPEFRDNRSTIQHSLKKIDGRWFIVNSTLLKTEELIGINIQKRAQDEIAIRDCIDKYYKALDDFDANALCSVSIFQKDSDRMEMIDFFKKQKQMQNQFGITSDMQTTVESCKLIEYDGTDATAEVVIRLFIGGQDGPPSKTQWEFKKVDDKWYAIAPSPSDK